MPVEFEDDYNPASRNIYRRPKLPKFVSWLIKMQFAKTEEQANKILLTASIVFFSISAIGFIWGWHNAKTNATEPYRFSNDLVKRLPSQIQNEISK